MICHKYHKMALRLLLVLVLTFAPSILAQAHPDLIPYLSRCQEQGLPSKYEVSHFGTTEADLCPGEGSFQAYSIVASKNNMVAFGRLVGANGYLDEINHPATVESDGRVKIYV